MNSMLRIAENIHQSVVEVYVVFYVTTGYHPLVIFDFDERIAYSVNVFQNGLHFYVKAII